MHHSPRRIALGIPLICLGILLGLNSGLTRRAKAVPQEPQEKLAPLDNDKPGISYSDSRIGFPPDAAKVGNRVVLPRDAKGKIHLKIYRQGLNNTARPMRHRHLIQFFATGTSAPCNAGTVTQPPLLQAEFLPFDFAPGGRENSVTSWAAAVPPGDYDLVIVTASPGSTKPFVEKNPNQDQQWSTYGSTRYPVTVK